MRKSTCAVKTFASVIYKHCYILYFLQQHLHFQNLVIGSILRRENVLQLHSIVFDRIDDDT